MLNFSTFSVGGSWGQPILLFSKLDDETQIFIPPEATRHYIFKKIVNYSTPQGHLVTLTYLIDEYIN